MKKIKTFFAVTVFCTVISIGYNTYNNISNEELLLIENIEALTQDESMTSGTTCDASNTNPCKIYDNGLLVGEGTGALYHI